MAKKKRKRRRRPVAPPVHSAPDAVHGPAGPPPADAPPARPFTPEPPPTATEPTTRASAGVPRTRDIQRRRGAARRQRGRRRTYLIVGTIVLLIVAFVAVNQVLNSRRAAEFNRLASAAGCGELQVTGGGGGMQHLAEGQTTRYDTSPPTHGAHDPRALPAGIYEDPFTSQPGEGSTIYKAVHSLEHGYIIVWHDDLTSEQERALERRYRTERKVIVVPYPQLRGETRMAVTAWARIIRCEEPSTAVIDEMIDRFREARSAPEPRAA